MLLSDECQSHISFIIVQVIHNINYQSVWVAYLDPACSMMCLCTGVSALIVTSQVTTDYIKLIYFLHQIEPTAIQWDLLWSTDLPLLTVHTWSSHCYSQAQDVLADPSDAFLQRDASWSRWTKLVQSRFLMIGNQTLLSSLAIDPLFLKKSLQGKNWRNTKTWETYLECLN